MANAIKKIINIFKNKKAFLSIIIVFLLVIGIRIGYAYYYSKSSFDIMASVIGDFDVPFSDINMVIYKEKDDESFQKVYTIPAIGYEFNDELTKCTIDCINGQNGKCHYTYDSSNRRFDLTSEQTVTCKFYFTQKASSDINIYILIEDENGEVTLNDKNYKLSDYIPAYGYKYNTYTCDKNATVTYDAATRQFSVSTTSKNTCYAYFDNNGDADIIVNVFVQNEIGSKLYRQVNSISENYIYKLSNVKKSECYDENNNVVSAEISYADGYISVTASERETCNVYLDIDEN